MIVDIPYDPRPQQKELHEKLKEFRFSVLACHRRFGKSVMLINHLLIEAMLNTKKNPRYAYIAPTYRQAKNIAWDYLKQFKVDTELPSVENQSDRWITEDGDSFYYEMNEIV